MVPPISTLTRAGEFLQEFVLAPGTGGYGSTSGVGIVKGRGPNPYIEQ